MKIWIAIIILLLITSCDSQNSLSQNDQEKQNLLAAIEKFNTAFAEGNLVLLDSMTTENYLHTNGSSKVINKTNWFNYLEKRSKDLEAGTIKIIDYQLEDTAIEHYENMAIVTGKVIVKTKDSSGIMKNQYRITNFWVLEEDRWKRAGFHDGKIE